MSNYARTTNMDRGGLRQAGTPHARRQPRSAHTYAAALPCVQITQIRGRAHGHRSGFVFLLPSSSENKCSININLI